MVRLVKKTDKNIETILKIDHASFHDVLLNNWLLPTFIGYGKVFGLFNRNSLKGFAIFIKSWDNHRYAYLVETAIDEEIQGKGCGSYLLLKSFLHLKKNGISIVGLTVDPSNSRALHVYRDKFGFKFVEYRKNEYGQGRDRLFLKMDLDNWNGKRCKPSL